MSNKVAYSEVHLNGDGLYSFQVTLVEGGTIESRSYSTYIPCLFDLRYVESMEDELIKWMRGM